MRHAHDRCIEAGLQILDTAFVVVDKSNTVESDDVKQTKKQLGGYYLPAHIKVIHLYNLDDFGLGHPAY